MMRLTRAIALGMSLGAVMAMASCDKSNHSAENKGRTVIQKLPDPSGKWVAIVDEVEYANGLLTSMADRVCLVGPKSKEVDGVLIFSADAMPEGEKPTISWDSNHLVVTISKNSKILHQDQKMGDIQIEVRKR